jgi:hypothetical protein
MAQLLVRDLRPETVSRLKTRAKAHRRSLQAELKDVLENASRQGGLDGRAWPTVYGGSLPAGNTAIAST